jgi:hypothetical protein
MFKPFQAAVGTVSPARKKIEDRSGAPVKKLGTATPGSDI